MMNWVDLVIVLLLAFFTFEGIGKSFIAESLDFLLFLLSFVFSIRFYDFAASILENNFKVIHSIANVFGFFIIWFSTELILSLLARYLFTNKHILELFDLKLKNLSPIPSFLKGLILIAIILLLVATFPIQPWIKQAVNDSKIGTVILNNVYQLELPLKEIFRGITEDTLTFLTVEPKTDESINLGFKTSNFKTRVDLESQMIDLVNKERVSRGIKPLVFDENLRVIAREHSDDMLERGYFSHYSPEGKTVADRANSHGIPYEVIGENLAYAPNLELAHNGLMNSPGHRANILSADYNKIGIGIDDAGVYGLMVTQVFSN